MCNLKNARDLNSCLKGKKTPAYNILDNTSIYPKFNSYGDMDISISALVNPSSSLNSIGTFINGVNLNDKYPTSWLENKKTPVYNILDNTSIYPKFNSNGDMDISISALVNPSSSLNSIGTFINGVNLNDMYQNGWVVDKNTSSYNIINSEIGWKDEVDVSFSAFAKPSSSLNSIGTFINPANLATSGPIKWLDDLTGLYSINENKTLSYHRNDTFYLEKISSKLENTLLQNVQFSLEKAEYHEDNEKVIINLHVTVNGDYNNVGENNKIIIYNV